MTDDDALITKAAEALRAKYPDHYGTTAAKDVARAVIEAVRNDIAAALREAARAESINFVVTTAQLMDRADRLDPKETP